MILQHRLHHLRIVEVQVRLMTEEAVPVVRLGDRVPGPVRGFGIGEDDARAKVFLVGIAPYIKIALRRAGRRAARGLKPRVLIGGVVDDQFGDHLEAEAVRLVQHVAKIVEGAELRVHVLIVGNVIAVILERRGIEGHQPDGVDAQVADVLQLGGQAFEVADAIVIGIEEGLDVDLIDDGIFIPKRVIGADAGRAAPLPEPVLGRRSSRNLPRTARHK